MAGQLNALGVTGFFADAVGSQLTRANLGWKPLFGLLSIAYYALHYMFASQTAHVGALYSAFLAMMLSSGARLPHSIPHSASFPSAAGCDAHQPAELVGICARLCLGVGSCPDLVIYCCTDVSHVVRFIAIEPGLLSSHGCQAWSCCCRCQSQDVLRPSLELP